MIGNASARLRRAFVAVAMTTAAVATAVGTAGPAHAVTSCSTTTVLDEGGKTANHVMQWGDFEAVHVNVSATCSGSTTDYVTTGTTVLQASTNGGSTWTTVKSATGYSAAYLSFYGTNVIKRNTLFRAMYSGGTDSTYSFTASHDSLVIGMIRKTGYTWKSVRGGVHYVWKISPTASIQGMKAKFYKKTSTGWKWVKTVRVNSTGHAAATFGVGHYKITLPSGRGFLGSYRKFGVTRY